MKCVSHRPEAALALWSQLHTAQLCIRATIGTFWKFRKILALPINRIGNDRPFEPNNRAGTSEKRSGTKRRDFGSKRRWTSSQGRRRKGDFGTAILAIIRTLIAMIRRPVCQLPSAPRQSTGSRAAQKRFVSDRSLEQCEAAALARAEAEGWGGFPEEDETLARLLAEELAARAPRRMSGQQNIKARDEVTMARAFPRRAVHLCACVYARAMVLPHLH